MKKIFFHLSDLHYVAEKAETYGVILSALFNDMQKRFKELNAERFLILSGDVIKQGSDRAGYDDLLSILEARFKNIGIPREKIICVPGNHDLSRDAVKSVLIEHEGIISQCDSEATFNEYVRGKDTFTEKFENYLSFEKRLSDNGVGEKALGKGHVIASGVGVYCLNSAYFSAGGLDGPKGAIQDKGRLVIDSRGLHEWIQRENFTTRILVMHHPLDWLAEWSAKEIKALLAKNIDLLVTGHVHDQEFYTQATGMGAYSHCMAPALYTAKNEVLGYAAIFLGEDNRPEKIEYRQWVPKTHSFVVGAGFSSTDDGTILLGTHISSLARESSGGSASMLMTQGVGGGIVSMLKERLDAALKYFHGQPIIFVEPILSNYSEAMSTRNEKPKPTHGVLGILERGFPSVVHAPPQFGLTCLARYFCYRAFDSTGKLWVYIDALVTKPHRQAIAQAVESELVALGIKMADVQGVVIDSVRSSDKDSVKLVHKTAEFYPGLDILFMRSNDSPGDGELNTVAGREVVSSFLWSMPRSSIRKIVSEYSDIKPLGNEDVVTARLAQDLEMMNIHRTPLNCFTLLKVSEFLHEDSPVNRAELIKRVLYLLFNGDDVPTYKSRPDVKDCEFVLGFFCERIIRSGDVRFRRDDFRISITKFCRENLIDIDVDWVFDVLFRNNIIVTRGYGFEFKFVYWIMYFAAQRMCQNEAFKSYIFADERYSAFPEIVEFYTGINRSMSDAVEILAADLRAATAEFDSKIALPDEFDIFSVAQWTTSAPALEQMRVETTRGVESSNLPASVKDQYADRSYDSSRPYAQDIGSVLQGFSYNKMLQGMRAASKALRNSDYVETSLKRKLLSEIISVWDRAATVLLVLVPALAKNGEAAFDDVRYVLDGSFPDDLRERFQLVLQEIPRNISSYYEDDLFSHKMGPLLANELSSELSNMGRHFIALVLIRNRPRNWSEAIKSYIYSLHKNSFFLLDIYKCLRSEYSFGYVSDAGLEELSSLIKSCAAKHVTGAKELGQRKVNAIVGKIDGDNVVPERQVGRDGELLEAQLDESQQAL